MRATVKLLTVTIFVLKELSLGECVSKINNKLKQTTELVNNCKNECFYEFNRRLVPIIAPERINTSICFRYYNFTKNYHVERKGIQKRSLHRIFKNSKTYLPLNPIKQIHNRLFHNNNNLLKNILNTLNLNTVSQTAKEADNIPVSMVSTWQNQIEKDLPNTTEVAEFTDALTVKHYNNISSTIVDENTTKGFGTHHLYETMNGKILSAGSVDAFDSKLYQVTREKILSISPNDRKINGISFVKSGIFLYLSLLALSTEVDPSIKADIDRCLAETRSDKSRIRLINEVMTNLPASSGELTFRWSLRLAISRKVNLSQRFRDTVAPVLRLQLHEFNGTEAPEILANILNEMVKNDSGYALHETFEANELSEGIRGVLLTTLYFRGRWRSAPTLLNGTTTFLDAEGTPRRSSQMIRINDVMLYADLQDWDAQVIEINYATPDLSFLIIVPKSQLLEPLIHHVSNSTLEDVIAKMRPKRIAVTMPLYTLRMTLLLPNKLMEMGMTSLIDGSNKDSQLRLSHAVQRIMFWAEAGRNAFKDDGLEWDDPPEKELIVNRPYLFYVRWRNMTLMNGNFVL